MLKFKKKAGAQSTKDYSLFDEGTEPASATRAKCRGILHGEGVLVHEQKDISRLIQLGCYGKGIFSRSVPTHHSLPQLSQLVRTSRRRRQQTAAGTAASSAATSSASASEGKPEWVEKLNCYEKDEMKRIALHSEWKSEKEKLTQPRDKATLIELTSKEEESSTVSQATKVVACETTSAIDDMSTEACGVRRDAEKPAELRSTEPEALYKDFVERIEKLRETDPFPIKEPLQLSCEEATYLSVKLDILQVLAADRRPVTTETLWAHFCSVCGRFVERYTAYQYYRSKGWVPKSGLKFGVDFLLYKEGPSFYHSTYAVIVSLLEHATEQSQESFVSSSSPQSGISWREVIALDRVNEAAGKELIVCYVMKPPSFSQDELKLPSCVASLEVREMFVKRWVPERERQTE